MSAPSRLLGIALVAGLALQASACSDSPTAVLFDAPVDLTLPWAAASPEAAGMARPSLDRALERAGGIPQLRSLLVVRKGHLVVERYYGGASPDDVADVRSVTKSVVSTLSGLALARGHLTSLDQPIGEILDPDVADLDEVERRITVRHLLTMSGGWEWVEAGAVGYNEWITSADPIGFLLAKPHVAEPGATFTYSSAAVHLLGVVLEEAVGTSLPAFAAKELFEPMGVGGAVWEPLDGRVNGGSGIDLRPRDLARLGQLFLQDGWSGSSQVLPPGWVEEATAARYSWRSDVGPTEASYGYLWWTDEENHAFFAWGYGGQFIYVAPRRDLVVVATTQWWGGIPSDMSRQVLGLIVEGVLPAAPER